MIFDELPGPILKNGGSHWSVKFIKNDGLYFCFGFANNIRSSQEILIFGPHKDLSSKFLNAYIKNFKDVSIKNSSEFDDFILENCKDENNDIFYIAGYSFFSRNLSKDDIFNALSYDIQKIILFNINEWNNLFKD